MIMVYFTSKLNNLFCYLFAIQTGNIAEYPPWKNSAETKIKSLRDEIIINKCVGGREYFGIDKLYKTLHTYKNQRDQNIHYIYHH